MSDGYDQLSTFRQQAVPGDDVIVTQWEATERGVDPAVGNRLKLVNEREFHPFDGDAMKHLLQHRHQREGQLVEATSQETYPQNCGRSSGGGGNAGAAGSAPSRKRTPRGVNETRRLVRSKSGPPTSRSSARI